MMRKLVFGIIVAAVIGVVALVVLVPKIAQRSRPVVIAVNSSQPTPRRNEPLTLAEVKRIYVEPVSSIDRPLRTTAVDIENPPLKFALTQKQVFTVVDSRNEADAVFSLKEELVRTDKTETFRKGPISYSWARITAANVEATLKDATFGTVLWTAKKTKTVTGSPYYHELDAELVDQLHADYSTAQSGKP